MDASLYQVKECKFYSDGATTALQQRVRLHPLVTAIAAEPGGRFETTRTPDPPTATTWSLTPPTCGWSSTSRSATRASSTGRSAMKRRCRHLVRRPGQTRPPVRRENGIYILGDKSWSIDMQRYNFQFTGQRFYKIEHGRLGVELRDVAYQAATTGFWNSMEVVSGPHTYVLGGAEPSRQVFRPVAHQVEPPCRTSNGAGHPVAALHSSGVVCQVRLDGFVPGDGCRWP